jgi:uncharacterized protein
VALSRSDQDTITDQLNREPRGAREVAARCPCGGPAVVETEPRLPDGTPFPTTYYITCPRLAGAIGTLEASGLMREMEERLHADPDLQAAYQRAHVAYLADRTALGEVPEIAEISAGGMPNRVKCLHVLVGHSLAKGFGVNPLGDEARERLGEWWKPVSCVERQAICE